MGRASSCLTTRFVHLHRLQHSLTLTFFPHYKIPHEANTYKIPWKNRRNSQLGFPAKQGTAARTTTTLLRFTQLSPGDLPIPGSWRPPLLKQGFYFDVGCRKGTGVCRAQLLYPVTDFLTVAGQAEDRLSFHHFWTGIPPLTLNYYPHTGILASLCSR